MADGNLDYYSVLGLSPSASHDEIRAAHRRLVKERHPDSGGTAEMFRVLQAAYEVLIDPESRAEYDRELADGRAGRSARPGGGASVGFNFDDLVGRPAGTTVEYLESTGIHPIIRMVAVTDPRLDGVILAVEANAAGVTLTVGVSEVTAMWFARIGITALQTAWEITKRGALVAKAAADTGMKELEAVRDAGPEHEIARPWQAKGCMFRIYLVFALVVIVVLVIGSIPAGAKIGLSAATALMLSPFAIGVALHRTARRKFYRQG